MASAGRETNVVYAAGMAQGIVLVTFPAASAVFADPDEYDLSNTQYGALFLPQVITAISAALLGPSLGGRFGVKRVYLAGLVAGLSDGPADRQRFVDIGSRLRFLLLLATAFLGVGFGLTVPALNTFAAAFHPGSDQPRDPGAQRPARPGHGACPGVRGDLRRARFLVGAPGDVGVPAYPADRRQRAPSPANTGSAACGGGAPAWIPSRFWAYAGFAVLYGICETVNGNWSQLDMTRELGASATEASLALTAFWGMVTLGRVLFAALQRRVAAAGDLPRPAIRPRGCVHHHRAASERLAWLGVLAFGLAGLGALRFSR